jgi:hypothetical protein
MTFQGALYDLHHGEDGALVGNSIYNEKKARNSITLSHTNESVTPSKTELQVRYKHSVLE